MLEIGMKDVVQNYGFASVLSGAGLEIMTGDRVALVGRNGSGKSTILKIIAGLEAPVSGIVTVRRGATVGYLEQIPQLLSRDTDVHAVLMEPFGDVIDVETRMRALEARLSVETDADALDKLMRSYAHQQSAYESMGGYAIEEEIARVATGFGIVPLLSRPFNVLSGGQKTIVCLARTILAKPDILLLDEPTNHLDIKTLEWFEAYVAKYRGTVIVVSHDRYFLDQVAQKTILLENGQCTLYHGNYTFSQKEHERELLLQFEQYKNQKKRMEAMQAAIARFRDWGARGDNPAMFAKAKMLEARLEAMERIEKPKLEAQRLPLAFAGGRTGKEALVLRDLSVTIGDLKLVSKANCTIFYQDRVCLSGENGSGKTTLLRAILGTLPMAGGEAVLTARARIGYIPQEIRFAEKASVLAAFRAECPCAEGQARGILAKYAFYGEHVNKRAMSLSGGEKMLLKLCILVQQQINFLVLDEPTNHIDIATREMLEESLLSFSGTLLFVSHDRYFISKVATRRLVIEGGTLREVEM